MVFVMSASSFLRLGWTGVALAAFCLASGIRSAAETLSDRIAHHMESWALPNAGFGIQVVSLPSRRVVYETNAHRAFVPASTTKTFTSALALDRLGGDYRIKTSLLARTAPDKAGVISGDLVVFGRGDPTLHSGWGASRDGLDLSRLVEALAETGVREIRGDLVCHDGFFRGPAHGLGWAWDDLLESYASPVSALTLNDNLVRVDVVPGTSVGSPATLRVSPFQPSDLELSVTVKTGNTNTPSHIELSREPGATLLKIGGFIPLAAPPQSLEVPVLNPARYFGERFRSELARKGIRVTGRVRLERDIELEQFREVASVHSAPMADLVKAMMKPSNNTAAQLLWLQCGAIVSEYPSDAELEWPKLERTTDAARRSMDALLKRLEIPTTEVQLEEGSGLSRANLISPAALVRLMGIMDRHAWSAAWRDALPIGGRDGTLRNRFTQGPTLERVIAKTGSLRNVATLSGYVMSQSGQRYAFAVMINQNLEGTAKARGEMDRLIELIAADSTPPESGSSPE